MVRKISVVLAFILALMDAVPAKAVGEFSSGNWKGTAYFKDGKFTHCNMWAPFINQWDLLFTIAQDGYFTMFLRNQKLDLRGDLLFGTKSAIRLQIDDTPLIIRPFTPVSFNMTATKFATNLDWVERLSTGKVLRINTGSRTYRFPLTDLKQALALLHVCASKYRSA